MTETDTCDEMAILRRIPTNCHTTPARQWIVGDRADTEIDAVDLEIAMCWADHNVALRSSFAEGHPGYHYHVDHHGDLAICRADSGDTVASTDARAELADDLADDAVTVEAILVDETAPEHLRSVGKRIVTDGGTVSHPAERVYCENCHQFNSHDDGDCALCGERIKEVATDGGQPKYDLEIAAADVLNAFAADAADYAHDHDEKRQLWRDSCDMPSEFHEARYWMLEALGGRRAYHNAMIELQPGGKFRNEDETVALREFMAWISERAEAAHQRAYGGYTETRQADEAETAYTQMLSTLRDEFGVGWPRLDDTGGNPLDCDMP